MWHSHLNIINRNGYEIFRKIEHRTDDLMFSKKEQCHGGFVLSRRAIILHWAI